MKDIVNAIANALEAATNLAEELKNTKDTDRIILIGAHGTGKTTLANALNEKMYTPVVESVAREMKKIFNLAGPYVNDVRRQDMMCEMAMWDFKRWKDIATIFTRCPLDTLAYTMADIDNAAANDNGHMADEFRKIKDGYWKKWFEDEEFREMLTNSTFIYLPIEFGIEDDGVRPTEVQYQQAVDKHMRRLMKDFGIKPIVVSGTVEERVEQVIDWVFGDGILAELAKM